MDERQLMFEIEKKFRFEAGHQLVHHNGLCQTPHGHSYELIVTLRKNTLIASGPQKNMVIDFLDISDTVKPMIEEFLDHKWLNDSLKTDSPTAEFIARWIFEHLAPKFADLYSITIYETESSKVVYTAPT